MKRKSKEIKAIGKMTIAVPYYGSLSLPPSGLSRIFFLAEVDLERKSIVNVALQVWDPKKEPNLFVWLKQMETDGLICSDAPSNYEVALSAEGIWVQWGQEGEVQEVVQRWMADHLGGAKNPNAKPSDAPSPDETENAFEIEGV